MKFIVLTEENGYELRYWDETKNEIGGTIVSDWNKKTFAQKIELFGVNIKKESLKKVFFQIDAGKPFVVLVSSGDDDLTPFDQKEFVIE
jgi:hypothetical protein